MTIQMRAVRRPGQLKNLVEAGFLQRVFLPRAVQHAGSSPFVYTLASRGRRYLQGLGLSVPAHYRPSEEAEHEHSLLFLSHTLAVNDFLIAAGLLARRRPKVRLEAMIHERKLRREPVYLAEEERRVPIVPDGWLDLLVAGSHQEETRKGGCVPAPARCARREHILKKRPVGGPSDRQ